MANIATGVDAIARRIAERLSGNRGNNAPLLVDDLERFLSSVMSSQRYAGKQAGEGKQAGLDAAHAARVRDQAFAICNKFGQGSNHITVDQYVSYLATMFKDRADSLQNLLDVVENEAAGAGNVNNDEEGESLSAAQMDRFSRQIGAYGVRMMQQLVKMDVLIVGLDGVGAEAAKNIVLAGPSSVTLFDTSPLTANSRAANFFASDADVGRTTDIVCAEQLREMNDGVKIRTVYAGEGGAAAPALSDAARERLLEQPNGQKRVMLSQYPLAGTGELTEDVVRAHGCVLFTGQICQDAAAMDRWGRFCHDNNIGFVASHTMGAMGFCFTDFGDKWETFDENGEPEAVRAVVGIINVDNVGDLIEEEENLMSQHRKRIDELEAIPEEDRDQQTQGQLNELVDAVSECRTSLKRLKGLRVMCEETPEDSFILLDTQQQDLRVDAEDHNGAYFTLEGVKGMTHKQDSGVDVNTVGMWKIGSRVCFPKPERTIKLHNPFTGEDVSVVKDKGKTTYDPFIVRTSDTRAFNKYQGGGTLTQKKAPTRHAYKSYSAAATAPAIVQCEFANWGVEKHLHIAVQAIQAFVAQNGGALPGADDLDAVAKLAAGVVEQIPGDQFFGFEADTEAFLAVLRKTVTYCRYQLHPLQAFFGGVAAQEVMKFTGKFTPLGQWLYLDCFQLLSDEVPSDNAPQGSRYDDLIGLFGAAFVDKIRESRTYMVGCGALGCEFAKNYAMIGLGTQGDGAIHVTDPDNIEVSNLARQFLFRKEHAEAKANKASTARGAILRMNPDMNVTTYTKYAAPSTEDVFSDEFYDSMTFVTNALDNVKARAYVDGRIVDRCKALLESGTQGTKCNSLVIVPHMTESYTDGAQISDEDGDAIPMCTLRLFPNLINHCVEWARANFTDMFEAPFHYASEFFADKDSYLARLKAQAEQKPRIKGTKRHELETILKIVEVMREGVTFERCVQLACLQMLENHRNNINDLTHQFPRDKMEKGKPFWSSRRRFPQAATVNLDDPLQMRYLICVANILAVNYGLQPVPDATRPDTLVADDHAWRNPETIRAALEGFDVPAWVYSGKVESTSDQAAAEKKKAEQKDGNEAGAEKFDELVAALEAADVSGAAVVEADFEKDLDANFHIDFIWAATNLRAWNYQLETTTRHKAKMIAGKIIPAILTATASICGLMTIEALKLIKGVDKIEGYRNATCNLGTNYYAMQEPPPVKKNDTEAEAKSMLESAQRSHKSTMERYEKKLGESKELSERDLQTIANVKSRLESAEAAIKSAVPCYPSGWSKWDKITINANEMSYNSLCQKIAEITGHQVTTLSNRSGTCILFDAKMSLTYLEAYPGYAQFFDKSNKMMWRAGKSHRKKAKAWNKDRERFLQNMDLMEHARTKCTEWLQTDAVQDGLEAIASTEAEKSYLEKLKRDVANTKGDVDAYNRSRAGMYFHAACYSDDTAVLMPSIYWSWAGSSDSVDEVAAKVGETKIE